MINRPSLDYKRDTNRVPRLGHKVKELRKRARLTAYELQKRSGIAAASIYNLERGGYNEEHVHLKTLKAVSLALANELERAPNSVFIELAGFEEEADTVTDAD